MRTRKKCRYPNCYSINLQRWGLCNKHRKWIERGFMTAEFVMIKPIRERVTRFCKVEECEEKTRRHGFCERHSWEYKRGVRLETGEMNPQRRGKVKYNRDFPCLLCGKTGKITKGLCRLHYSQYHKGLINIDGSETGRRKRAHYSRGTICRVPTCAEKPRGRGYCNKHLAQVISGVVDAAGNRIKPFLNYNRGKTCRHCQKPAWVKLLCPTHYSRARRGLPPGGSSGKNTKGIFPKEN